MLNGTIPPALFKQSGNIAVNFVASKTYVYIKNDGSKECHGAGNLLEFAGIRTEQLNRISTRNPCNFTRVYRGILQPIELQRPRLHWVFRRIPWPFKVLERVELVDSVTRFHQTVLLTTSPTHPTPPPTLDLPTPSFRGSKSTTSASPTNSSTPSSSTPSAAPRSSTRLSCSPKCPELHHPVVSHEYGNGLAIESASGIKKRNHETMGTTGQIQANLQIQTNLLLLSSHVSISPSPTSSSPVASPASSTYSKQSLMEAATAISEGKSEAAAEILARMITTQVPDPRPNSEQRLLEFLGLALKSRVGPIDKFAAGKRAFWAGA
ncbi:hypothetical protein ACFX1R_028697 [Malus domestica]